MQSQYAPQVRIVIFYVLPIILVLAGWYTVIAQSQSLEQATIASYQAAQLEIVESTARAADIYITRELASRGEEAIPEIEQEVLEFFVQPIQVGTYGDAWIHTPDYVIFDESEDFPAEFVGVSIADVFETRAAAEGADTRPREYATLVEGITSGAPGVTTYVWVANKAAEFVPWWESFTRDVGVEVAAWTTVDVFPGTAEERVWVVGLSTMLPELMTLNGAYAQINAGIITMIFVTLGAGALLFVLWQTERDRQTNEARYQAIVEYQTELVARFRPEGTLTFVNEAFARYAGQSPQALFGQNIRTLLRKPDDEANAHVQSLHDSTTDTTRREQEVQFGTDEPHWLAITERAIRDQQGNLVEIQLVASDITAQKHAEAMQMQAEAERADLQQQIIATQQSTLRELSTPLMPISEHVVVMPLVGSIDTQRAQMIQETLLEGVSTYRAELVILDITGVPVVDTQVGSALIQAAQSIRLLGAQVILTGIQPQIAQTLVQLGVDLRSIRTAATLQQAVAMVFTEQAPRMPTR